MSRKYTEVWQRIKADDVCVLHIKHPSMASTIRIGVIKEKNRDLPFKMFNEEKLRLKIEYDPERQRMTFKLVARLGMAEKVVV